MKKGITQTKMTGKENKVLNSLSTSCFLLFPCDCTKC